MKYFVVSSLMALTLVAADDPCVTLTSAFPACPFACVSSAASAVGCTNTADLSCNCIPASSSSIMNLALGCAVKCPASDLGPAISAGSALCACEATRTKEPPNTKPTATTTPTGAPTSTPTRAPTSTSGTGTKTGTTGTGTNTGTTGTGTGTETTIQPTITTGPTCVPSNPCDAVKSKVPKCASSCIGSAAQAVGCNTDNLSCQCASSAAIQKSAFGCVSSACGLQTGAEVLQSVSAVCRCVTANPTKPCSGGTGTTTPPGSSSSGGGGSSSSSAPGTVTSGCSPASQPDCGAVASTAVPSCAQQCFSSAAPSVGCKVTDFKCQCQPAAQSSLSIALLPCVQKNCPATSLQAIINGASSVCACATAPPAGGSGDCTATPTGTPTGTASIPGGETTIPTCDHGCGEPTGTQPTGQPTSGGQQPTGNPTGGVTTTGDGQPPAPTSTSPPATAGAATYEVSLVAGVFGAFWLAAIAL